MTEKQGVPVPYVTAVLGAILTLTCGGIFWLVSTTNEVPGIMRDMEIMKDARIDHEIRLRALERHVGPYRGDSQ